MGPVGRSGKRAVGESRERSQSRRAVWISALLVLGVQFCGAQSLMVETATIRSQVREVRVVVIATDKKSRPLPALSPTDFDLFDDDHRVAALTLFSRCADKHLRVAV